MNSKRTTLFTFLFFLFQTSFAQDLSAKIEQAILPYYQNQAFTGSVLVTQKDKIIFQKGYGYANREWETKNQPNTKFRIASMSKSFTAVLVLQLVEEGKLNLDALITQYLASYPKEKGEKITIHHLLGHTSGIPNYFEIPDWFSGKYRKNISANEFIEVLGQLELRFEPGNSYMYSNSGYYLLGQIIEKVTGKSYYEVLKEKIIKPLQMNSTGVASHRQILKNKADGYVLAEKGGYKNQSYINMELFLASGSLYSTIEDLYKWDQALYTEKLLSDKSKKLLFKKENNYSWEIEEMKFKNHNLAKKTIGYNGQIEGFSSMITRFIDDNHCIILLGNNGTTYQLKKKLTEDIAKVLYQITSTNQKQKLSLVLLNAVTNNKLSEEINTYKTNPDLYFKDEQLINSLAYQLLWAGLKEKAIRIFELNSEIFPESINAIYNLAEGYKESGSMDKAKPLYKQVLDVYPDNEYVKGILK